MKTILKKIYQNFFPPRKVIQKTYESWANKNYNPEPIISFVIQTHNKSRTVLKFIQKLRQVKNSEIIVIDDGSKKKESILLLDKLNGANEFILKANDLYEVITYDRAIYLSRGKYVALLQDDDDFTDLNWVNDAVKHFEKFTDLVFLGGRLGMNMLPFETTADNVRGEYEVANGYGQRKNSFKYKFVGGDIEPGDFKFAQVVIRAPMWVNRQLFIDNIKHIDQTFAPFQWDDAEVCLRAYSLGLKVGWYRTNFRIGGSALGGMRIWNTDLIHRQDEVNANKIYALYSNKFQKFQTIIDKANDNIN
ncbi:glycosyltransferase family A protein [Mucilaginibacter sp.]|uniref:glycosyltransferase family A protein n=1 Tax=Mucilaginibacter sp. TaxID=1882438 RepID=UPI00261649B4|nr:glycosyltransferase family A protein [Mucilaginibacter sp.]MDB4926956.1 glycosyltransferase [Mucilaginibacter sp.]